MVSGRYAQVLAGRWRLLCVGFVLAVFALLSGVGVPLAKLDRGSDKQWVPAGGKLADQIDFMAPYEEANRELIIRQLVSMLNDSGTAAQEQAAAALAGTLAA